MVLDNNADEVEIVMPIGKFLAEKFDEIRQEIQQIKVFMKDKQLKVILESGIIQDLKKIKQASFLCLDAGADFIKTSTGKNGPGASPEAVFVMCESIKEYYRRTGNVRGIKPAGGVSEVETARVYYLIVKKLLGDEWLNPERFRIGASRLANNILGERYF